MCMGAIISMYNLTKINMANQETPRQREAVNRTAESRLSIEQEGRTLRERLKETLTSKESVLQYLDHIDNWLIGSTIETLGFPLMDVLRITRIRCNELLASATNKQQRVDAIIFYLNRFITIVEPHLPTIADIHHTQEIFNELKLKKAVWERIRQEV